jgi:hypothetical protein
MNRDLPIEEAVMANSPTTRPPTGWKKSPTNNTKADSAPKRNH